MPEKGEVRRGSSETVIWDGSRWNPAPPPQTVDQPRSFGLLDYVPGLRDVLNIPENVVKGARALPDVARNLVHEPVATLKGFGEGVSEAATPGRTGLLALLTGGATVPAALAAAGGQSLAEAGRVATDAPNAPQSFPEAAEDVAGAAAVPAIPAAFRAAPSGTARRLIGAGVGGYTGYKLDGLPGAAIGAVTGGLGAGRGSATMRALRAVLGDTAEAVPAAEAPTASVPDVEPTPQPDSVLSGVRLSPEAVARNIEATNLRDVEGYSHNMAGKLAGIPGAGKAVVTRVPMGDYAITDEMIKNAGGTVTPPPEPIDYDAIGDPRDPPVASSMQGLERATSPLPQMRLPSSWMNVPSDEEMEADILARKANGRWQDRQ